MRILIATGIYPPDIGGPATYTFLLENELPNKGFKVGVLAFTKYRKMPKIIRHLAYFFRCLLLAKNYDIIYAQDPVSVGLPAMLAAKLSGRKFVIRVAGDYAWEQAAQRFGVKDNIDDFQHANSVPPVKASGNANAPMRMKKYPWQVRLLIKIQKFVVGKADLVITPSNYFRELVSKWTINPEKVKTIYNGVDLNMGGYGNWIRWKPQPSVSRIVSAGRLVPWKGFDKLIEFMVDLPDWQLVIIGDGPEMNNLKQLIANLKLESRVQLTGMVPRKELLEKYLKGADACIFALNTSFESFSFQVVEAMNAGIPVIATRIGNLGEIITNNHNGILIEPNNKEEFLRAVMKIASNQKFRENLSMNAQVRAKDFSIENTIDNLVKLLSANNPSSKTQKLFP